MKVVILVTGKDKKEARKITDVLVKERLAACVNILDNINSFFWWKGKIQESKEALLIIKSEKKLLPKIIKKIKGIHSYTCPEIIALPIIGGNKDYLEWITSSVR